MRFRYVAVGIAAGIALATLVLVGLPTASVATAQPGVPVPAGDSLNGTWQIISAIDDGQLMTQQLLRDQFVKDGRLTIKGNLMTLTRPGQPNAREVAFVTDGTKSPKTIDLAGTDRIGSKGIFMKDGDTLMLAIGVHGNDPRPTDFSSLPGSNRVVLTMHRVPADQPYVFPPPPPAPPPPPPAPTPDADAVLRKQLVGTWGSQDDHTVTYITLNPDGTYGTTVTWKKGLGKMFHEDLRMSGTWKVENGSLVSRVTASTDRERMNQIYSLRVVTIDSYEVVFSDPSGRLQRQWKVR